MPKRPGQCLSHCPGTHEAADLKLSRAVPLVARVTNWRRRSLVRKNRIAISARPGTNAARRINEQIRKRESNLFS